MLTLTLPPKVTDRAYLRLAEIAAATGEARALRVAVEGGGCSGFQYDIKLDDPQPDDLVWKRTACGCWSMPLSLPFLENAVIDFSDELIGARFVVETRTRPRPAAAGPASRSDRRRAARPASHSLPAPSP